jgi:hypothetical protein
MAESAEETLFFNSLRLCVSAVEKSWRLKRIYRRGAETQRKNKSKKGMPASGRIVRLPRVVEARRNAFGSSLRLCVSAVKSR